MSPLHLQPAQVVEVVQTVQTRQGPWETRVRGRVVSCDARPTGSWFAHGKHDKLWLRRLRLQKEDGELVEMVIDEATRVKVLDAPR